MENKDLNTKTASWTRYFLEFLLLFAAVTLGFFAENQREKWGENERGIQFAQRLIEDIDLDSLRFDEVLQNYSLKKTQLKTLIPLLQSIPPEDRFFDSLYTYFTLPGASSLVTGISFVENLSTRDELKAGNMRLIRSSDIVRHLSFYARREEIFIGNQTRYREKRLELLASLEEIFDMPLLGWERIRGVEKPAMKKISQDPATIRKIANAIVHLQGLINNLESNIDGIQAERKILKTHLLEYIEKKGKS
jgi:hypothetical protein